MVGTTQRSDGDPQVTYNGHPLYLYEGDQKAGDTNGEGLTAFGGGWFAMSATGDQVPAGLSLGLRHVGSRRQWLLALARLSWTKTGREAVVVAAAYVLGAVLLAGEAAVHVQQYASIFHDVRWIGPLFLANAAASIAAIAGLANPRTRRSRH